MGPTRRAGGLARLVIENRETKPPGQPPKPKQAKPKHAKRPPTGSYLALKAAKKARWAPAGTADQAAPHADEQHLPGLHAALAEGGRGAAYGTLVGLLSSGHGHTSKALRRRRLQEEGANSSEVRRPWAVNSIVVLTQRDLHQLTVSTAKRANVPAFARL